MLEFRYKRCTLCKQIKFIEEFYAENSNADKHRCECKLCCNERHRKHKHWYRKHHLMKKYGITINEYNRILALQDGKCKICNTNAPISNRSFFDVDHYEDEYGEIFIRGLLCTHCNTALGLLKHNVELIRAAENYIHAS